MIEHVYKKYYRYNRQALDTSPHDNPAENESSDKGDRSAEVMAEKLRQLLTKMNDLSPSKWSGGASRKAERIPSTRRRDEKALLTHIVLETERKCREMYERI